MFVSSKTEWKRFLGYFFIVLFFCCRFEDFLSPTFYRQQMRHRYPRSRLYPLSFSVCYLLFKWLYYLIVNLSRQGPFTYLSV